MGSYVPNTKAQQQEMLKEIGLAHVDDLFEQIPREVRVKGGLDLPDGMSEQAVRRTMEDMAARNKVYRTILRGAGAYDHYIPAVVTSVTSKEEFVTAYTPYQAEISQGILQSIFEFQTMICELTGMEAANASVYDGATAAAEAIAMCRDRKRSTVYVSAAADPQVKSVMKTYCFGSGAKIIEVPDTDGRTDLAALKELLRGDGGASCFYVQQPNYYGVLEDCTALGEIVHSAGAKLIMGCNPVALGILKSPGECGADIAVGDAQPLGMPLSFGGPYAGFMAAGSAMFRKLPGRIVGETTDANGDRAFVLTLQAREQHIRREKASSNICSNQALCALTAAVYLAAVGPDGLKEVAVQCLSKAHYLAGALCGAGLSLKYDSPYFHEFVTIVPDGVDTADILRALDKEDILGGLALSDTEILWCATEKNTKQDLDRAAAIVAAAIAGAAGKEAS